MVDYTDVGFVIPVSIACSWTEEIREFFSAYNDVGYIILITQLMLEESETSPFGIVKVRIDFLDISYPNPTHCRSGDNILLPIYPIHKLLILVPSHILSESINEAPLIYSCPNSNQLMHTATELLFNNISSKQLYLGIYQKIVQIF